MANPLSFLKSSTKKKIAPDEEGAQVAAEQSSAAAEPQVPADASAAAAESGTTDDGAQAAPEAAPMAESAPVEDSASTENDAAAPAPSPSADSEVQRRSIGDIVGEMDTPDEATAKAVDEAPSEPAETTDAAETPEPAAAAEPAPEPDAEVPAEPAEEAAVEPAQQVPAEPPHEASVEPAEEAPAESAAEPAAQPEDEEPAEEPATTEAAEQPAAEASVEPAAEAAVPAAEEDQPSAAASAPPQEQQAPEEPEVDEPETDEPAAEQPEADKADAEQVQAEQQAAKQRSVSDIVGPSPATAPVEPSGPPPTRAAIEATARAAYAEALQAVGRFFKAGRTADAGASATLPIGEIESVAAKLVSGMTDVHVGDALVASAVGPYPDEGRFIVPHSVNVAVLSQRVGQQLGLEAQELQTLAVAALVHDVGTVRIDKETFYKEDSLTNEEWEQMRQRPTFSSEIIASLGAQYRAVAEIAHQVHERLDGNGYPRGLTVDSIALEASILGAVDIFEAFIHPRPYKKTVPAAAMYGVDNLMRMSHQFGDGVLKALVRSVGLFPVGTHVRLNSGEVARVLRGRSANPMRPEVEVVYDTQKRKLKEPRYIDLMSTPHLYVFKPLSPEELVEYHL